ncbi:redoxin family protein [Flavivirga sp. 57AJ16]|uniref:redoxin family protein n=1 Tax=Flavivirga sp. 57AJ16 TaxID=3025307 RepID=UPI002366986D|nr:redoxin family protein [Flavivirga sp. 57AJ16]MDD7885627.1 redoxin family protein [Flavivirga sp. 57AJ16]
MKHIAITLLVLFVIACKQDIKINKLKKGTYRGLLKVNEATDLPFSFKVISENKIHILNAEEVIEVDDVSYKYDSVFIKMPVFEGYLVAKIENNALVGRFVKKGLNRVMGFSAEKSMIRFDRSESAKHDISGHWETVFSPDSDTNKYMAKGTFSHKGNIVTGTFRTTTGDYRYLEGVLDGDQLKLSTFDGAHAFLFIAMVTDSSMVGTFYSGNHFQEPFVAKRNDTYELPDANTLTFLKEGYDKVEFSFPDETGTMVSLNDARFNNKVVLVQIMGTWCPNCLDESKFYSEFYKNNRDKDIEIVALAFEYVKTEDVAFNNIKRLKDKTGITYPILLAQYGSSSKVRAQEKLPMLNHVLSYPTTIFIDKKGKVRKIHTGFNGPATKEKYVAFKKGFKTFVDVLLEE